MSRKEHHNKQQEEVRALSIDRIPSAGPAPKPIDVSEVFSLTSMSLGSQPRLIEAFRFLMR